MTDNEIIANEILCIRRRASGRCNGGTDCNTCDLLMNETEIIKAYQRAMKQNDLINRQKEEIDRLNIELQSMRSAANSYKMHYETAKSEAIKEFAEKLKHEITSAIDTYYNSNGGGYYLAEDVIDDIDNLVKEMTEVSE